MGFHFMQKSMILNGQIQSPVTKRNLLVRNVRLVLVLLTYLLLDVLVVSLLYVTLNSSFVINVGCEHFSVN